MMQPATPHDVLAQQQRYGRWRLAGLVEHTEALPRTRRHERMPDATALLEDALEELQVAEEELRAQAEELASVREGMRAEGQDYRHLFEHAPDPMLVTTPTGMLQRVNVAAEMLLELPRERLEGKPLVLLLAPADRREFLRGMNRLAGPGTEGETWPLHVQRRHGTPVPVDARVTVVDDARGEPAALYWSVRVREGAESQSSSGA